MGAYGSLSTAGQFFMMRKPVVAVVFGTRPEAIKMAPVVVALRAAADLECIVCVTGQHQQMLDQVLGFFEIEVDERFDAMTGESTLGQLTGRLLTGLERIFIQRRPDLVLVHGDTATSLAGALAAYFTRTPLGHVEAGLRTHDKFAPWPEEINRRLTGGIADLHFSPTERARSNLLAENVADTDIFVTGNTVIDALHLASARIEATGSDDALMVDFPFLTERRRLILVTGHRRENFGEGIASICRALLRLADRGDVDVLYPIHLNPNINDPVRSMLLDHPRIHLSLPLDYKNFVALLRRSYIVLTDSGGVQEEAPGFGKPVLVMRNTTERPEAIEAGVACLVGTSENSIVDTAARLLDDPLFYASMATAINPFGDGQAADRIVEIIRQRLSTLRSTSNS
jgi:UDP-N-acetylglucosamine 2-epimerase (non-hydrolysing)